MKFYRFFQNVYVLEHMKPLIDKLTSHETYTYLAKKIRRNLTLRVISTFQEPK